MSVHWLLDGHAADALPLDDRGLAYGDGLFETMLVRDRVPWLLDQHLARLFAGCERLGIPAPAIDALSGDIERLCEQADDSAVLKIIVTRGGGGRGYRPPADPHPRRIVGLFPHEPAPMEWSEHGIALRWCDTTLARQPAFAGLKHLNRLEQVMARAEWDDTARWQEGLMCDTAGAVVSATQANLFIVRGGVLSTPSLTHCGVAGILRGMVLESGIPVDERELSRADIEGADEIFVCNSVHGIWPVREVADTAFEAPGPVTRRVQEWIHER